MKRNPISSTMQFAGKLYVYNNIEDILLFEGSEQEYITFVRKIAVENDDEDIMPTNKKSCHHYIETYCDNLSNSVLGFVITDKNGNTTDNGFLRTEEELTDYKGQYALPRVDFFYDEGHIDNATIWGKSLFEIKD